MADSRILDIGILAAVGIGLALVLPKVLASLGGTGGTSGGGGGGGPGPTPTSPITLNLDTGPAPVQPGPAALDQGHATVFLDTHSNTPKVSVGGPVPQTVPNYVPDLVTGSGADAVAWINTYRNDKYPNASLPLRTITTGGNLDAYDRALTEARYRARGWL